MDLLTEIPILKLLLMINEEQKYFIKLKCTSITHSMGKVWLQSEKRIDFSEPDIVVATSKE
jgi:hypothetical protein